jgi:hypothetical protein
VSTAQPSPLVDQRPPAAEGQVAGVFSLRWLAARVKRLLARLMLLLLLLVCLMAVGLLVVLEETPSVKRGETIAPTAIAEARRVLARNDPRRLRRGEQRTAEIPAALIDEAVNFVASRSLGGRGAFVMFEETAEIRLAIPARLLAGRYLNLRAVFQEAEGEPRVVAAAIGSSSLPPVLAEAFIAAAIRIAGVGEQWLLARQAIRQLAFEPTRAVLQVTYVWEPKLLEQAVALAFTPEDIARMLAVQRDLAALLDHYAVNVRIPLVQVLTPLLAQADDRTREHGRAVLLVLATYLAEKNLAMILPQARKWPRARRVKLMLANRLIGRPGVLLQ